MVTRLGMWWLCGWGDGLLCGVVRFFRTAELLSFSLLLGWLDILLGLGVWLL